MGNPATASYARRSVSVLALIALLMQLAVPLLAFPARALAQDEEAATPTAPVDTTAPVVAVPAGITVTADAATGTAIVTFNVSASDDVDGPVAATCDWASGAAFPVGATTVTCTATDSAGNAGSGSFVVTVNPAPEPEPTQAPEPAATQAPESVATEEPAPEATLRPVTGPPTIKSDKDDYAPGERVTLTGTNWQPGEAVRIVVNDDQGQTWKRDVTVIADENGNIIDAFNLPDWFVAVYTVNATGAVSGTATTTFTDANLRFLSSGPTLSNVSWSKFSNSSCTTPLTGSGTSGSGNITSNDSATLNVDADVNQWVKLTAPATVGGLSFVNWTATSGGGSFSTSDGGRTICAAGDNNSGLRRFTANYAAVNTAPVANGQSVTTNEDTAKTITLSGTDADGNTLTFSIVSGPSHGSLSTLGSPNCSVSGGAWTCTASVTYTPASNYNGPDSFTFKVNDGTVDSSPATVSITVTAVNDAPSFTKGGNQTVNEDAGPQMVSNWATNISAGPADESGQTLTFVVTNNNTALFSVPPAISPSGTLTYTPAPNANGSATVTVVLKDNGGTANGGVDTSAPQTFTITVYPVNDAPVAADDTHTTDEDTPLTVSAPGVLTNDSDVDGDQLSAILVGNPSHGTLTLNADGSFTYTPGLNFNGTDSFTYKVSDGSLDSNVATVTITVTAVNDAPDAVNDSVTVAEDSGTNAIDVLGNDTDIDGNTLSVTAVGTASHGTAALVSGQVRYTPDPDYFGSDSFTYTISDGNGGTDTATVAITVTEVNDAPQATDDAQSVAEDGSLTFDPRTNDAPGPANESGQTLTVTDVTQGAHGTVTFTGSSVTYTPDPNFFGDDSFTYTVTDNGTTDGEPDPQSATATVTITVSAVNDAPVAVDDLATTDEDTALTFSQADLTGNDTDVDNTNAELSITAVSGATHGTAALNPDGTIDFTPATNFFGEAGFDYTVSDGDLTDTGHVTITVNPVNDAPVADDQSVTTDEDTSTAITLTATDVEGDSLTYTIVTGPSHGSLSGTAPNLTYTPDANYNGSDSFTFKVSDGSADSNIASVSITINPINDTPVADAGGPYTGDEGAPIQLDGSGSLDVDVDPLTYAWSVSDSSVCSFDDDTAQAPLLTCADNGSFMVTLKVSDGELEDTATAEVTVNNVAPTLTISGEDSVDEGSVYTLSLNSEDPGDDTISKWTIDWGDGTVEELSGDPSTATHIYADGPASYTITATATDEDGTFDANEQHVEVNNVAPTIHNVTNNGPVTEGSSATITVAASDPAGTNDLLQYSFDCNGDSDYDDAGDIADSVSNEGTCAVQNDGEYLVNVRVSDGDAGVATSSTTVTANNVAPVVATDNAAVTIDEGQTASNTGTFGDVFDPVTLSASVGTVEDNGDGTWSWSYATTDGPAQSQTVTITATDDDTSSTATFSLTVINVAPAATFNAPASVSEGSSITISLTDPSDPSSVDTTEGFAYAFDCGDGSGYGAFGSSTTASCPTTDNGTRTVKGKIRDKDGGVSEYSASVTVTNVAPAATLGNNGPVAEGSPVTISFSDQSDPSSADTSAGFHYAYSCTNGNLSGATYAASSTSTSTTCTFADNGSYTVRARIIDKDNGYSEYTTTVTVNNVAPSVTAPANQTAAEGTAKAFNLGSFSDPGADSPWAVDVNWGDGSPHTTFNVTAAGSLGTASHTYADNGTYTVTVMVTDKDGASDSTTFQVTVANVAPVITEATFGSSSVNCGANTVTLTVRFTDPGDDTHKILVDWSDTPANDNAEINPAMKGGAANTIQHTFNSGGPYWATVIVIELDPEAASAQTTSSQISVSYQVSGILPPINPNGSSVFKSGSTIPVKIQVLDCAGVPVATLAPKITIVKISGNDPSTSINEDFYSTSNADTGQVMRYSDGQYIYNLATKSLSDQSATYELKISIPVNGTVVTVRFGLRTK